MSGGWFGRPKKHYDEFEGAINDPEDEYDDDGEPLSWQQEDE